LAGPSQALKRPGKGGLSKARLDRSFLDRDNNPTITVSYPCPGGSTALSKVNVLGRPGLTAALAEVTLTTFVLDFLNASWARDAPSYRFKEDLQSYMIPVEPGTALRLRLRLRLRLLASPSTPFPASRSKCAAAGSCPAAGTKAPAPSAERRRGESPADAPHCRSRCAGRAEPLPPEGRAGAALPPGAAAQLASPASRQAAGPVEALPVAIVVGVTVVGGALVIMLVVFVAELCRRRRRSGADGSGKRRAPEQQVGRGAG
jgi:hypothetical protein